MPSPLPPGVLRKRPPDALPPGVLRRRAAVPAPATAQSQAPPTAGPPMPLPGDVENTQGVTEWERTQLNNLSPGPEASAQWLSKRGYHTAIIDGDVAVKRPGSPRWQRIEPTGFAQGGLSELGRDLTQDALNEYGQIAATGIGAAKLGAAGALVNPALGVVGGIAGAAGGSAAFKAGELAAAKAAGFDVGGLGGAAKQVGIAALEGGIGEGAGKALVGGARLGGRIISRALDVPVERQSISGVLQLPPERLAAAEASQSARAASARSLAGVRDAKFKLATEREAVRRGKAAETSARADYGAVRLAEQADLDSRIASSGKLADEAIKRGKVLMGSEKPAQATVSQVTKTVTKTPSGAYLELPSHIASPDWGVTADILKKYPEYGAVLRRSWGDEFVPVLADGTKRGSHSMAQRSARLSAVIKEKGPDWAAKASKQYIDDLSAFVLGHPEFGKDPALMAAARAVGKGTVTPATVKTFTNLFESRLTGSLVSPELAAAAKSLRGAKQTHLEARAGLQAAEGRQEGLAHKRLLHEVSGIQTAKALSKERALYASGKPMRASSGLSSLADAGRRVLVEGLGKPAAAAGRFLTPARERALRRLSAKATRAGARAAAISR